MLRNMVLLAMLALTGSVCAGPRTTLDPGIGVVLAPEQARDLLHQCSRATPKPVQGTWQPAPDQIRRLEALLPPALEAALKQRNDYPQIASRLSQHLADYGRQYGGFVVGGRKVIYVNAYPQSIIDFDGTDIADWSRDAKRKAISVCDGGARFFGVEYDPDAMTFRNFQFNGEA
jgi:hypothetical protein